MPLIISKKKDATTNPVLSIFSYTLVISLTMLGRYEEAEEVVRHVENLAEEGTHNWFKGLEQHLVLEFYKRDYQAAWEVFSKATSHSILKVGKFASRPVGKKADFQLLKTGLFRKPLFFKYKFTHLAVGEQETWKIFEAYIHLLIIAGKIELPDKEQKKMEFKPARFLNEIPEFSKDKRGMNIPILIVHALSPLFLERYDGAYDRMLALDKYAGRYLNEGDDAFRAFCFIKALLQIKNADFKKAASEVAAAEWLQKWPQSPSSMPMHRMKSRLFLTNIYGHWQWIGGGELSLERESQVLTESLDVKQRSCITD